MSGRRVSVAVPVPVDRTFDYALPEGLDVGPGQRVLVPYGSRRVVGMVVSREGADERSAPDRPRAVIEAVDAEPVLPEALVRVILAAAHASFCPPGIAFRSAVPPGSAPRIGRRVALRPAGAQALERGEVPAPWRAGLEALVRPLTLAQLGARHPQLAAALVQLERLGWVESAEIAERGRVQPRMEPIYRSAPDLDLVEWQTRLRAAPRQRELLERLASSGPLALRSEPALRALIRAGAVQRALEEQLRTPPASGVESAAAAPPTLTPAQREAVARIESAIEAHSSERFLLYGITGSGKTEVYLRAAARARELGRSAIVLVPEISLTHQLVDRFRARFGSAIALLHSGLGAGERFDQWRSVRGPGPAIVIGARSAIFAPLHDVGLIAVDEEHDPAYQSEDAFRYHAREVAELRAREQGCPLVLGSATPDVETAYRARQRELITLRLPERVADRPLPDVQIVDMENEPRGARILSRALRGALAETLSRSQQAILFVNRRGFASRSYCFACGYALRCKHCDISLVYHASGGRLRPESPEQGELRCHYCGYCEDPRPSCAQCGSREGALLGFGTERLEEEISAMFPRARVARLDRDTSAPRGAQARILGSFHRRETDVLIGTQMVAKGHDVPGVTLVGVVAADLGLHLPDYRAGERTFQLLTQVAGRAGRGDEPGRVVIQTFLPAHYAIALSRTHDYASFFREELGRREPHGYPPFRSLVRVGIAGPEATRVRAASEALAQLARSHAAEHGVQILGPAPALIERLRDQYHWQLVLLGDAPGVYALARVVLESTTAKSATLRVRVVRGPTEML